jgi:hypothetical protein
MFDALHLLSIEITNRYAPSFVQVRKKTFIVLAISYLKWMELLNFGGFFR